MTYFLLYEKNVRFDFEDELKNFHEKQMKGPNFFQLRFFLIFEQGLEEKLRLTQTKPFNFLKFSEGDKIWVKFGSKAKFRRDDADVTYIM